MGGPEPSLHRESTDSLILKSTLRRGFLFISILAAEEGNHKMRRKTMLISSSALLREVVNYIATVNYVYPPHHIPNCTFLTCIFCMVFSASSFISSFSIEEAVGSAYVLRKHKLQVLHV